MRRVIVLALSLAVMGCQHLLPKQVGAEPTFEKVQFASENSAILDAYLFKPRGNGPFPAIVGLHGCAGLVKKDGKLNPREIEWGKYLAANGFVVLYPDSFTTRDVKEICTRTDMRDMARKIRPEDSYNALRWLQKQPFVDPAESALIGWSNGGSSLLWTIAKKPNFRPVDLASDFKIAIAVYPGCNSAERSKRWVNRLPLEIHIGDLDDWASPEQCRSLVNRSDPQMAKIVLYPDAHHDFDAPNLPIMTKRNLAYPTKHGNFATIGTNEKARENLMKNILAKLQGELMFQ